MLIVGAGGHALEVWQCLSEAEREGVVFYDDVRPGLPPHLLGQPLLTTPAAAQAYLAGTDPHFVLGLGSPVIRQKLAEQFGNWGGQLTSVVAATAVVGPHTGHLGPGLNLMHHTLVAPNARLGTGVLLNAGAAVHHDVAVGDYSEIMPGARLLGGCRLGRGCRVGALAAVLPGVALGDGATVGAGAVVVRDVPAGATVVGVPARPLPGSRN